MKNNIMKLGTLGLLGLLTACGTVEADERGVFTNFGTVEGPVEPGLHFYNVFTTSLDTLQISPLKWNNSSNTYTSDFQNAKVDYTITYQLNPSKVRDVWLSARGEWAERFIPSVVESSIKQVIGKTTAISLIQNRAVSEATIKDIVNTYLSKRGIIVSEFSIRDVSFSEEFEKAVERKQTAVENAQTSRNKTLQVEEEAKQTVITATAVAEAMKIKSEALKSSPKLAEYEAVLAWRDTGGKVPTYMVVGNNGGPIPFMPIGK